MNKRWSADSSTNDTTADRPVGQPGELGEARVIEPHRDLGRQVLELVAGQPELGKDDEVGARLARAREQVPVLGDVLVERAQAGRDLGERDTGGLHVPEHSERRSVPRRREPTGPKRDVPRCGC